MDRNNQKQQALYLTAENIIFVTPLITTIKVLTSDWPVQFQSCITQYYWLFLLQPFLTALIKPMFLVIIL